MCKAMGIEKGKQLVGRSTIFSEPEAPDPVLVARRIEEVDISISSLAETDFVGHFCLGELDYDSFHQFCHRPSPGSSSSD